MDNNQNALKIRKIIYLTIFLVFTIIAGYFIYNFVTFRITNMNPSISKITTVTPFLKIKFNKNIKSIDKISDNQNSISKYEINKNQIEIDFNDNLSADVTYTININGIKSTDNKTISNLKYTFKPSTDLSKIPADQNKVLIQKQAQYNNTVESNKLLKLLPFTGPNFEYSINYTLNSDDSFVIVITTPSAQGKDDALHWLTAQGVNTSNTNIQYINSQVP